MIQKTTSTIYGIMDYNGYARFQDITIQITIKLQQMISPDNSNTAINSLIKKTYRYTIARRCKKNRYYKNSDVLWVTAPRAMNMEGSNMLP